MKMPGGRSGILSLSIKDKAALYSAYMPFIANGGLFIPTDKDYQLGEEIFLLLNVMDEPEKIPVAGKVVWITPRAPRATAPPASACSSPTRTIPPAAPSRTTWPAPCNRIAPPIPCNPR
ncbi:pilus assembly protein PilZ [Alcanivorax sp. IO_7]|nr:pilus assembly protein PilZ [Alcanivorax sp. IO_7]